MRWTAVGRHLVPLDHAGARRFYFENLHVAHNRRERLEACLLRRLPAARRVRLRLASAPSGSGGHGDPPLEPDRRRIERVLEGLPAPPTATWILQGAYDGAAGTAGGRAVAFLFGSDDERPAAVLKLRYRSRQEGASAGLDAEVAALRRLAPTSGATGDAVPPASVPRLLGRSSEGEVDAVLLSWLPGRSAYVDLYRDLRPARHAGTHLRAAATWLAAFHDATAAGPDTGPGGLETPSARHGDFWARNLLLQRAAVPSARSAAPPVAGDRTGASAERTLGTPASVSVVDWEGYRPSASPLGDLFHFPLTYALEFPWRRLRRVSPEEAFRRGFVADTPVSRAIGAYLQTYARGRGLDPASLEPGFHRYLLDQARRPDTPSERHGRIPWRRFQELLTGAPRSVFSSSSTR